MRTSRFVLTLLCLACLSCASLALAADKAEKKLPKSGTLSTNSSSTGAGNHKVDMPWGVDEQASNAPIEGSVSRASGGDWMMRIFNTSKDTYSVDLAVSQTDARGSNVKTDHFSYSLRGGQSAERRVPAGLNSANAELKLNGWKKSGGK